MNLPEAQSILREHGLEDFPRPWIFDTARNLETGMGVLSEITAWKTMVPYSNLEMLYDPNVEIARETALMMGWKPKGEGDG